MQIGTAIRKVRTKRGLTQQELATKCGLSRISICQIEGGQKQPKVGNLKRICEELQVPEAILYLHGLEPVDVSENKRDLFQQLQPLINNLINMLD